MINSRRKIRTVLSFTAVAAFFVAIHIGAGQTKLTDATYRVLPPIARDNFAIFPIVSDFARDTHNFLTLDEGLRSGQVVITEGGASTGLVRPRLNNRPWQERPYPMPPRSQGAEVNRLVLANNSGRPLILLAGEIVTGGKQDRVVGKDRIIPANSDPIELSVFCVEPHRWVETSNRFGGFDFLMVQPSVRKQAMANKDQQAVWDEVARSRMAVAAATPTASQVMGGTSSYAVTMQDRYVQQEVDGVAAPMERSYDKLKSELQAQKAVGAIVAINGEIVWADVFASASLFDKYWPKLIRSYAAEAVSARWHSVKMNTPPSAREAQIFLDDLSARTESVEAEPGVYRNTEIAGEDFDAFLLTSLLPGTGFNVHIAKMKK